MKARVCLWRVVTLLTWVAVGVIVVVLIYVAVASYVLQASLHVLRSSSLTLYWLILSCIFLFLSPKRIRSLIKESFMQLQKTHVFYILVRMFTYCFIFSPSFWSRQLNFHLINYSLSFSRSSWSNLRITVCRSSLSSSEKFIPLNRVNQSVPV